MDVARLRISKMTNKMPESNMMLFLNRRVRYSIYSIASSLLGVVCCFLFYELSDIEWFSFFGFFWICFVIASLVFVIKMTVELFRSDKLWQVSSIFLLIVLLGGWYVANSIGLFENHRFHMYRAVNGNGFHQIIAVGNLLKNYVKENNHFPNANSWSDDLSHNYSEKRLFHIGQFPNIECVFAFN
jgi:hypothetical protein